MHSILVVDDEKGIREFLEITLKKEGYEVTLSSNGEEAVELCQKREFDIVLADIKMPKGDGHMVLRKVKKLWPETIIILITAYGSLESAIEAMKDGAYDYISKPFRSDEILLTLMKANERESCQRSFKIEPFSVVKTEPFSSIF